MSDTTTAPETGTKETAVSYPLESAILEILSGSRKVDLTATAARLAEQNPAGERKTLFTLPEPLQNLMAFNDVEVTAANLLIEECTALVAAHHASHEEDDEDRDSSEYEAFAAKVRGLHAEIQKRKDAIESCQKVLWVIVREMAGGFPDLEIAEGFAVIKSEAKPSMNDFIGSILARSLPGVMIQIGGNESSGSGRFFNNLFGRRRRF